MPLSAYLGKGTGGGMSEENRQNVALDDETLRQLRERIEHIQYGSVTVVIHGGKVVQLDTNTKIRLA